MHSRPGHLRRPLESAPASRSILIRSLLLCCLFISATAAHAADPPTPIESVDGATRAKWLVDGQVVDAESGKAIPSFVVTPGTMSKNDEGQTVIRWRDNLKRPMKDGQFQWPRTSGFSVMRFRVTADGYRDAITQRINRGGPHTRTRIKLAPLKTDPSDRTPENKLRLTE